MGPLVISQLGGNSDSKCRQANQSIFLLHTLRRNIANASAGLTLTSFLVSLLLAGQPVSRSFTLSFRWDCISESAQASLVGGIEQFNAHCCGILFPYGWYTSLLWPPCLNVRWSSNTEASLHLHLLTGMPNFTTSSYNGLYHFPAVLSLSSDNAVSVDQPAGF